MRFDYYAATIPVVSDHVITTLAGHMEAELQEGVGLHGYKRQVQFRRGGETVARCLYGGNNGAMPHVWASGDDAPAFADLVRQVYPKHRVTRMDSAQDYDGPGTWDKLYAVGVQHADAAGLKLHHAGDWHRKVDGRTAYIGSRKSSVFVRLYEKGKQLGADLVSTDAQDARTDWCRLELVVRPENDARYSAATATPEQAWGFSRWTRILLTAVNRTEVERVNMNRHRIPDHQESFLHACHQYALVFELMQQECGGSWEELGKKIGEIVKRKQDQQRNVRQAA